MKACQLLVLPSHYEGMPNVVLEAMACSRPVVCSRVEGSDELLGHAQELQTFRPGDAPAMAAAVQRFAQDDELAARIGDDNCRHVREKFSLSRMIDAYRSHYRYLLSRNARVE